MKNTICEEAARLCRQIYRDRLRAIVLGGSLARNEGTFVKDVEGVLLLGDADMLLVFDDETRLPVPSDLVVLRTKVEQRLQHRGLRASITLNAVHPEYLRSLPPTIFAYELRTCGDVVDGDPDILRLIPVFGPDQIPQEDAWRLLSNRLVEQLDSIEEILSGNLSPAAAYRTVKLYLDMATSWLLFSGGYAPTYADRASNLTKVSGPTDDPAPWPFPAPAFAADVAACTQWKLAPDTAVFSADRGFWERAIEYARRLWEWELARLERDTADGSRALIERSIRRDPLHKRLRGWAYVVRSQGWHRSFAQWPRWARQLTYGSPRHLVYAAGVTLLFTLQDSRNSARGCDVDALHRYLPVATLGEDSADTSPVVAVARAVVENYRNFVEETRA